VLCAILSLHYTLLYLRKKVIRSTIASHVVFLDTPLHVNKELKLYLCVSDFVKGYHQLMALIDAPLPFPLIQMNKCFLIIWIFTLPLVLHSDGMGTFSTLLAVFFMTYAFLGLELVSVQMDDPYGDDPTDIDVLGKAKDIFGDMYDCIHDIDGPEVSKRLRAYFSIQEMHDMDQSSIDNAIHTGRRQESGEYQPRRLNDTPNHRSLPTEYALRISMVKSPDAGDEKSKIMEQVKDTVKPYWESGQTN